MNGVTLKVTPFILLFKPYEKINPRLVVKPVIADGM